MSLFEADSRATIRSIVTRTLRLACAVERIDINYVQILVSSSTASGPPPPQGKANIDIKYSLSLFEAAGDKPLPYGWLGQCGEADGWLIG